MTAAAVPAQRATPLVIDKPGVYDIPEADYLGDPIPGGSLSFSGAKRILQAPARFRYDRDHPPKPTDAMRFGSAVHREVLGAGPDLHVIDAGSLRSNAAQAERDEAVALGLIPVLASEYQQVKAMGAAVRAHPTASRLLAEGQAERSAFWQDPETGIWCRARFDWMTRLGQRLGLVDFKTSSRPVDAKSIGRTVADYRYDMQDPYYCDSAKALGLDDDPAFIFIFQETRPPYFVAVVMLDDTDRAIGAHDNRIARHTYAECVRSGVWPAYGDGADVQVIQTPGWHRHQYPDVA